MAVIDIVFRKLRKSQVPFGGVHIIGNMDHSQIQPIRALPFLMSTMVTTCFTFVQLQHSVRAAEDPAFCRFQKLTRMYPTLLTSDELVDPETLSSDDVGPNGMTRKDVFCHLAGTLFEYVDSFQNDKVLLSMSFMFVRKNPVKNAIAVYVESLIQNLRRRGTPHYVC